MWPRQESFRLSISINNLWILLKAKYWEEAGLGRRRSRPSKDTVNTKPRKWRSASQACSRSGYTSNWHTCRGRCWSPTLQPSWRWSQTPGSDELQGHKGKECALREEMWPSGSELGLPFSRQLAWRLGRESPATEAPAFGKQVNGFQVMRLPQLTVTGFPPPCPLPPGRDSNLKLQINKVMFKRDCNNSRDQTFFLPYSREHFYF